MAELAKSDDPLTMEHKIINMFIDNAKTYVQISSGALVLSITFIREVLGLDKDQPLPHDLLLFFAWAFFLSAVISGVFYQYFVIKYLEKQAEVSEANYPSFLPKWPRDGPYLFYGTMLVTFCLGAVCFTAEAVALLNHPLSIKH